MFMSASSLMVVLTMLYIGARNKTEDQMAQVLKLDKLNKKEVLRNMEILVSTLKNGSTSVTLNTANGLFPHTDRTILEDYISLISKHFKAEVKSMDYTTDAEGARNEINKWVEEEINGKIKDVLPMGSLNPRTAMVNVNAIYFKGNWATQFKPEYTKEGTFTKLNSDTEQVDMMNMYMEEVKYGENRLLASKTLELPYEGKEMAMIVVLPYTHDGLPALEKRLNLENLQTLVSGVSTNTVEVSLPKFKLETLLDVTETLFNLGMSDLFQKNASNLSGIGKDLYVSHVYQKAIVEVNEEGTEAVAVTFALSVTDEESDLETLRFYADHPFIFMIWDHRLNIPLFIGRFVEPPRNAEPGFKQTKDEL